MPRTSDFDRLRVAALVIEAKQAGLNPAKVICEVLGISFDSARYRYRTVMDEGFLGIRPHYPVKVWIHRQRPNETSWMACGHCHYPWPCPEGFPQGVPTQFEEKHPLERVEQRRRGRPRKLRRPPTIVKGPPRIP
jgi:hypothetical protein